MTHESDPVDVDGGDGSRPITAAAVAAQIGGHVVGDADVVVRGVAPLDRAEPHELSFLAHARYASWLAQTRAGIVLMAPDMLNLPGTPGARIVVDKPAEAMVSLLAHFHRGERRDAGIHPTAVVAESARIAASVTIDAYAVVHDGAQIGEGCWIGPSAVVGAGCTLGRDVRLHAAVTLYPYVEIGDRVILHAGCRVGREGFGFVGGANGPVRIPHVGRCILESDVEVGANSCIDRGSVDDTIVGAGTKIDNLVHIAHNVRIGKMCFIAAQFGTAGSVRIGDGVRFGGQVGINGHITIGNGASLAGRSVAYGDVPAGEAWSGHPARPHREQLRAQAAVSKLSRLMRPLERLLAQEPEA